MSSAIRVDGVSKLYRRMAPGHQLRTLKSALLEGSLTAGLGSDETISALEDVSFEVGRGKAFGIIGSNGSGKSTMLKILAGMVKPSEGAVHVDGRVAALIELGAGFHPEISGRENIYINGAVLGLSKREVDERFEEIVEFSGLEDFIEEPVKNYSSGMYVRLGFSIAVHTDPDVLLVDEVLAVGDEAFAHRCLRRIEEFIGKGGTVLLVSHSLSLVEEFCSEVLWLENGQRRLIGTPRRVADAYRQAVAEEEGRGHQRAKEEREQELARAAQQEAEAARVEEAEASAAEVAAEEVEEEEPLRWGSKEAEILSAQLLDAQGEERYYYRSGDAVTVTLEVEAHEPLENVVFGVGIFTPRGVECWGTNTHLAGLVSDRLEGRATVRLGCPRLELGPGEYLVDVAVHKRDGYPYDYHRQILSFSVVSDTGGVGIYFPEHEWRFEGGIAWKPDST